MSNAKPCIILIEDDPGIYQIIRYKVEHENYRFLHREDGNEGWELLQEERPDLLILDIDLPGMTGDEILEKVRNSPELKGCNVMVLTGNKSDETLRQFIKLGVQDFMIKPFDAREFMMRVFKILQK